jgi:HK97 family phage prohead protease
MLPFADPGWLPDRRARYPIDTLEHAEASLAALDEAAGRYPPRRLHVLRSRIQRAVHRLDSTRTREAVGDVARAGQQLFHRTYTLDDIQIQRSGDGRTVEAYAAMFDAPYEVQDQYGHYMETIDRAAFNRTLTNGAGKSAMCLYNHGMTVHGTADALSSVPLGTPLEIRADGKGLLTVTRYNKSALADSVLESIRNGDIRSQSFRGRIIRSSPDRVPTVRRGGPLPTIVRHELGLTDYGAEILAVRSLAELREDFAALDDDGRLELLRSLGLEIPDGEDEDLEDDEAFDDDAEEDVEDDDTPTSADAELGAEDPPIKALRSATDIQRRIRAEMIRRGIA